MTITRAAATATLLAAELWAGAAFAGGAEGADVAVRSLGSPADSSAPAPAPRGRVLGLALGAGVPDGAAATVLYRPWRFVRLGGSLLYNLAGYGVGGSVTVAPSSFVAPSLTLDAGHFFDADARSAARRFTAVGADLDNWLRQVGYTYAGAQLGLEVGAPDRLVFYVRGGLSRVWARIHPLTNDVSIPASGGTVSYVGDPRVVLTLPTVKVGLAFFFY